MAFVETNASAFAVLLTAFIAFIAAARMAFVGTIACLVAFRTAFMAFIAAARIAFAMTRRGVSTTPLKRLNVSKMRS